MSHNAARPLRIGISLFVRPGAPPAEAAQSPQSLWENGIFQNCLFLAMLLRRVPGVGEVVLVAGGGGSPADAQAFLGEAPVPMIDMAAAGVRLDVMVEMSAQLGREWALAFRQRGGKLVSMRVGHDYVIDVERMLFDRPHALLVNGTPYDAVWTLPQYAASGAPYYASALRAPVRIVPHLWSPVVLERALQALPPGHAFGYRPGRRRWRIGLFEPNVCLVKTSFIPLLVCEAAHRANPHITERVQACNTFHMKAQPAFIGFAAALDIVRHGLVGFEGRHPTWQVLPMHCDAIVSHQWENAQNYLYYEALHGGYPLIHNSHLIGDCGYRYHDFDCEEGGQALLRAFAGHDENLAAYRATARRFLATLDPEAESNVRAYGAALELLGAA